MAITVLRGKSRKGRESSILTGPIYKKPRPSTQDEPSQHACVSPVTRSSTGTCSEWYCREDTLQGSFRSPSKHGNGKLTLRTETPSRIHFPTATPVALQDRRLGFTVCPMATLYEPAGEAKNQVAAQRFSARKASNHRQKGSPENTENALKTERRRSRNPLQNVLATELLLRGSRQTAEKNNEPGTSDLQLWRQLFKR